MNKIETVKMLLDTGSSESRLMLAKIIPCFTDTTRDPVVVADEVESLLPQLNEQTSEQWSVTVSWLRSD